MVYRTENMSIIMFSRSPSLAGVKTSICQKQYDPNAPQSVWMAVRVQGNGNWKIDKMILLYRVKARLKKKYRASQTMEESSRLFPPFLDCSSEKESDAILLGAKASAEGRKKSEGRGRLKRGERVDEERDRRVREGEGGGWKVDGGGAQVKKSAECDSRCAVQRKK